MRADTDRELVRIFGRKGGAKVHGWLNRSADWIRLHGYPVVKVGVDEAGPWWEVVTKGGEALWCLAETNRRGEWGGAAGVCDKRAGWGTDHEGVGPCKRHERMVDDERAGGDGYRGRTGAWVMAHGFARALEVSPWQGLITAVHIAAGRVDYIEKKLGEAQRDEDLMPDGELAWWVRQAETWHERLARMSKMAIDAGVAERLVKQVELESDLMLAATRQTLMAMGLGELEVERALGMMAKNLLELESSAVQTLEVLDVDTKRK